MLRRSLVTVAASAVVVTATGLPAVAVNNYPDEPSEAAASVLDSTLFQEPLLAAAYSDAGSESNAGPNEGNLNVELLGSELIQLGDVEVRLDEILDFGQLGALASKSEASSPKDAYAVSGLAGADGGVTLDGETDDFGKATVDVLSVARLLGVDGLTDEIVDQLLLEAGAGAAEVKAEDGVILDQDGVGGLGQYRVADLDLSLHSPVVENAAASVNDIGGQIDTAVEDLVNENLDQTALTELFGSIPGLPEPSITVDSNMQGTLFDSVTAEPITSANQLLTIDLSTGELQVHLDKLVDNPDETEGGLNELPPNYELIDDTTYPLIAETVHELMQEVTRVLLGAIEDSLDAVTVNIAFTDESELGNLDVKWSIPLASVANGEFPEAENNSTGTMIPLATTLVTLIDTLGPTLSTLLAPVYDLVISDQGDELFETLINDIKTDAITAPLREMLSPVFEALAQILSIQINRQVTEPADAVTPTATKAAAPVTSLDLSALSIALLPANEVARINLGNAAVRIQADDGGGDGDGPSLSVDPSVVAPGDDTEATGTGYTPDSTATVQLVDPDGEPIGDPIAVDTDADGGFVVDVPVPDDAAEGSYTVVGTDDTTGEAAEAPLTVQIGGGGDDECSDPSITADPTSVMAGEDVQVTGTGFPAGENVIVQLKDLDGNNIGDPVTVLVDADCGFTTPITVPEGTPPGVIIVDATPEDGGPGAQTPIAVVGGNDGGDRDLTAWFEKESVAAGDSQTFYASGFDEGESVVAMIESTPFGLPAVTADANGNVQWTFDVPEDFEVGTHVGTATSLDHGDQASAEFQVVAGNGGSGAGDEGAGSDAGLAATGANVAWMAGAMLLLLGAGAVMIRKRREISQAFATALGKN